MTEITACHHRTVWSLKAGFNNVTDYWKWFKLQRHNLLIKPVKSATVSMYKLLTSPVSTKCSKVIMPLLLLSLSLSKSSSDSTAEDPVEEMDELDSFLRKMPSDASPQSSCCISREEPPPSGVMVTCGTERASITGGGSVAKIFATSGVRSSQVLDDLLAVPRSERDPSSCAVPERGSGESESTMRGAKPIRFNCQIWSCHFQRRG